MWCRSVVNFSSVLCLATCRMRSSPCDTVARFCARSVLCWLAFPSAPALGSTDSAADRSALFTGFTATTAGSDFSRSCIIGYGSSPSRCGPWGQRAHRSNVRPPRFRRVPFVRGVFFDHGRASVPRMAGPHMLPSTLLTGSASAVLWLSRLNSTPHTIAVYASHPPSPATTQHSLPGARYGLPGPVSHRQDHASFPGAQAIQNAASKRRTGLLRRFRLRSSSYGGQVAPRDDVAHGSFFSDRIKKEPGSNASGFFVTSDGASSGADNRGRRNRRKAHIRNRNRPAGNNGVRSRSRSNHSPDRNSRTRPPRRRRVRRQPGRKPVRGRCRVPAPQPAPSRRWRQLWQRSPKLLAFSSCASPDIEYTRDNAEVFRWFQREPGSGAEIVRTISSVLSIFVSLRSRQRAVRFPFTLRNIRG